MRMFKKSLALLLALVMVLALGVNAFAADEMLISLDPVGDVTVYYTNDVHSYLDKENTYAKLATLHKTTANSLLVDAGDHVQGTAYGGMDKGETVIKLMNAAGYDVATLGNHEFDYGQDGRIKITDEWAEFPYVSANFRHVKNGVVGDYVLDAYKVFEVNGVKVAFVGITTPESYTKSTPKYFQDDAGNYLYNLAEDATGSKLYAAVQTAIDAASKEADIVIGLGHLGDDPTSSPWTSEEVIANTHGFDAFIDGHSHNDVPSKEVTDKDGHSVVLTQTGTALAAVGKMTITADGAITTELISLDGVEADADVAAINDAWVAEVDTLLGDKIAETDIDFTINYANGKRAVRSGETNMGDLNADAYYWLCTDQDLAPDMAIMNGGGIRASIDAGDWSYKSCKTVNTFGNVLCVAELTGQQILDALEFGARSTTGDPENRHEVGGFLHVAGCTYSVNAYVPHGLTLDDKDYWVAGPETYRVHDVKIYNRATGTYEALDLTKTYRVAGTNYTLMNCGDGFYMFEGAELILDGISEDYMAMASYLQAFKGGKISSANSPLAAYKGYLLNYENASGAGRITLNTSPFTDVAPSDWFFSYVVAETDAGVIDGMGDGTYAPAAELTWAEALKLLLTANGDLTNATGANWEKATIAKAASLGLVSADLDGSKAISRLDFCTAAAKLFDIEPSSGATIFTDCDDVYVTALVEAEVINGMGGTIFAPDATLTRAQIAKILYCLDNLA